MTRVNHPERPENTPVDIIFNGDCLDIMPTLPENSIDVILTDPVWPYAKAILPGSADPWTLWKNACAQFERLSKNLIVHLGGQSDPRFLKYVPESFKFQRTAFLRWIPPIYKGNILYECDIAYIFGDGRLPDDGTKVQPGEAHAVTSKFLIDTQGAVAVSQGARIERYGHPTTRDLRHVAWLIRWYTRPGELILDPFCGSGTTCEAARRQGRHYIGIEINHEFWQGAIKRLGKKTLFDNSGSKTDDKPTRQMHCDFHSKQKSENMPGNSTV